MTYARRWAEPTEPTMLLVVGPTLRTRSCVQRYKTQVLHTFGGKLNLFYLLNNNICCIWSSHRTHKVCERAIENNKINPSVEWVDQNPSNSWNSIYPPLENTTPLVGTLLAYWALKKVSTGAQTGSALRVDDHYNSLLIGEWVTGMFNWRAVHCLTFGLWIIKQNCVSNDVQEYYEP